MTSNSNKVAQLQNQLIDLGYPVDDPAGIYGPSTTAGVRDFQHHRGLSPDGLFGSATAQELRHVIDLVNSPPNQHFSARP